MGSPHGGIAVPSNPESVFRRRGRLFRVYCNHYNQTTKSQVNAGSGGKSGQIAAFYGIYRGPEGTQRPTRGWRG